MVPCAAFSYRNGRARRDHWDDVNKGRQERLYKAAEDRDQAEVFAAINNGASLKIADHHGATVLHMVVKQPCTEPGEEAKIIKILDLFLRQNRLNVDEKCKAGRTALHLAVKNKMIDVVEYLTRHGADLDARDSRGNWMAHYMVEGEWERYHELTRAAHMPAEKLRSYYWSSENFLSRMMSKKIVTDCTNKNDETPLQIAARRNLLHVLPILLQRTHDYTLCDKEKKTVLHILVENKKGSGMITMKSSCYDKRCVVEILEMMLDREYSVNAVDVHGNTPVHYAACQDEPQLIELMLKKFKKINACNEHGNSVLHLLIDNCIDSTSNQHIEEFVGCIRFLLFNGAGIGKRNKSGYKPVHLAVMRVHPMILEILKEHGANLKEPWNGGNLLHLLSQESSNVVELSKIKSVIRMLASHGCDVNARDINGMSPMHLAVQSGRNAVIRALAKCDADVDARDTGARRLTPLQMAVEDGHDASVDTLIDVGADVNAKDSSGRSALHLAVKFGSEDVVEKLLRSGAHVDTEDNDELHPIHYAIRRQNGIVLAELLKFGADINDVHTYRELVGLRDPGYVLWAVLEHWIKMKAAGLPVAPSYGAQVSDETYQEFYRDCLAEIEMLKAHRIAERTSLYDFVRMDWNLRCAYVGCKPIKDIVESTTIQTDFPKYHVLILAAYHEAVARQPLLAPAKRAWCVLTEILLPDVCIYRILAHLSNKDLRVMVDGWKQCNSSNGHSRNNRLHSN